MESGGCGHMVKELFFELDRLHFSGGIGAAGWRIRCEPLRNGLFGLASGGARLITIGEANLGDGQLLRETLLHEMIHAYLYLTNDPSHRGSNNSHGAAFLRELRRLQAAGETVNTDLQAYADIESAEQLSAAVQCFLGRQSRTLHPEGAFKNWKWYPSDNEWCSCCRSVHEPTRAFPYSLMQHCRTMAHVSHLYGVDSKELRKAVRATKAAMRDAVSGVAVAA